MCDAIFFVGYFAQGKIERLTTENDQLLKVSLQASTQRFKMFRLDVSWWHAHLTVSQVSDAHELAKAQLNNLKVHNSTILHD